MKENPFPHLPPTTEILRTCSRTIKPNGDILYTSTQYNIPNYLQDKQEEPYALILSPRGQGLLANSKLLDIMDREYTGSSVIGRKVIRGIRGFVLKENIGGFFRKYDVAVKQLFPYALDMTGIEQFEAMRLLEEEGVLCASPLAATKWRLIAQWINGKKAYCAGGKLTPYLEALDKVLKTYSSREMESQMEDRAATRQLYNQ